MSKSNNVILSAGGSGSDISFETTDVVVGAANEVLTNINIEDMFSAWVSVAQSGGVANVNAVLDIDNVTTLEANVSNGNTTTDLFYNNSSSGSANKAMPALDLGSPIGINAFRTYWYGSTWIATQFKIQVSNDLSNWTDVGTYNGVWSGSSAAYQEVGFTTVNARYIRFFCITGNNGTWVAFREFEAIQASGNVTTVEASSFDEISLVEDNGKIKVVNSSNSSVTVIINHQA